MSESSATQATSIASTSSIGISESQVDEKFEAFSKKVTQDVRNMFSHFLAEFRSQVNTSFSAPPSVS